MPEVNLEFLGRQIALVLEAQRELKADMATVKATLAETATRELILRVLRSFEGQVELADIRTQLLRETLEARLKAAETRLDALERV
ncbi:MAG: hypothetical protein U1E52_10865 [Geminicoccaceae bacterium]